MSQNDSILPPNNGTSLQDTAVALSRPLVVTMAAASGITVANLYYIQPLLAQIAAYLHVAQVSLGLAATLTQVGYAVGMLLILPLADIREKKSLILAMLGLSACALVFLALSRSAVTICVASFAVGFTSVVPQLLVPLAAQLSKPESRGRTIGSVMSGLLIGILLSRTFSGMLGAHFGWQSVYFIAAGLMVLLAVFLALRLPKCPSLSSMKYSELFRSMGELTRKLPTLRESAVSGGMMFAAFSVFWTTLSFLLAGPHFRLGADAAGLFGLVGVVGASAAPIAGRLSDHRSPRVAIGIGMAAIAVAFTCFLLFGYELAGLIVGVILLDLGVQSGQISNQARIHAISDEARNRINTVFMVAYFIGGSLGSSVGAYCFSRFGWPGVCIAGLVTQLVAVATQLNGCRRDRKARLGA